MSLNIMTYRDRGVYFLVSIVDPFEVSRKHNADPRHIDRNFFWNRKQPYRVTAQNDENKKTRKDNDRETGRQIGGEKPSITNEHPSQGPMSHLFAKVQLRFNARSLTDEYMDLLCAATYLGAVAAYRIARFSSQLTLVARGPAAARARVILDARTIRAHHMACRRGPRCADLVNSLGYARARSRPLPVHGVTLRALF